MSIDRYGILMYGIKINDENFDIEKHPEYLGVTGDINFDEILMFNYNPKYNTDKKLWYLDSGMCSGPSYIGIPLLRYNTENDEESVGFKMHDFIKCESDFFDFIEDHKIEFPNDFSKPQFYFINYVF